jgi:hypothetical protein
MKKFLNMAILATFSLTLTSCFSHNVKPADDLKLNQRLKWLKEESI